MRLLLALAGLFLATPALADTIAVYTMPDGQMTMTVEIASSGELRVSMGGKMIEEMQRRHPEVDVAQIGGIVRDGENYMLQPGPDGKVRVIRMTDAAAVMKEFMEGHLRDVPTPPDEVLEGPKLVEHGTATINGRIGKAFYVGDAKGVPVVVISTDPDLAELGAAMRRQFASSMQMLGSTGFPASGNFMDAALAQGAPLALSGMQLQTVRHDAIPAARFVLPAAPLPLDQVRTLMQPQQPAAPARRP